jgi:hypothetical protein
MNGNIIAKMTMNQAIQASSLPCLPHRLCAASGCASAIRAGSI